MAERTGAEELSSLVALLVQFDRFGTSISDTLKSYAHAMREDRNPVAVERGRLSGTIRQRRGHCPQHHPGHAGLAAV